MGEFVTPEALLRFTLVAFRSLILNNDWLSLQDSSLSKRIKILH